MEARLIFLFIRNLKVKRRTVTGSSSGEITPMCAAAGGDPATGRCARGVRYSSRRREEGNGRNRPIEMQSHYSFMYGRTRLLNSSMLLHFSPETSQVITSVVVVNFGLK